MALAANLDSEGAQIAARVETNLHLPNCTSTVSERNNSRWISFAITPVCKGLPAVFNNADTAPVRVSFKAAPSALRLRQPPHLAARAEQMLAGTTWLPEPSLTPVNESGDTQAMTS